MPLQVFLLLIVTAILWGITPVVEKVALKSTDPLTGLVIRSIFVAFVLLIICSVTGKWSQVMNTSARDKIFFCLSGLMAGLLGMLTYYFALKISPASKAVPIAATYPLVAAILGVIFLGENVTLLRIIGTVFIIAGVWLVK